MNSTDNHSQGSFTENKWLYEHLKQGLVRVHFFYFEKKKKSHFFLILLDILKLQVIIWHREKHHLQGINGCTTSVLVTHTTRTAV